MTNFFQHQAAARRRTTLLVVYFIAAVVALIVLTYLLVTVLFGVTESEEGLPRSLWQPGLLAGVTAGVLALVGGCTTYKVFELASGGHSVALLLGGQEIVGQTRDLRERRLLNIVEEMALASGLPVPTVYIMEEEGINAFAAGYKTSDAVIGVSRGALEYLNRDELQGVVAHEFSHILNGDMRINIRLIAIVFGIMALALIGSVFMRTRASSSSDNNKGGGQLVLLGLGLYILGLAGAFFGNLIKAAVSRQREYLADASAVQFTRNPDGIGGALKKIGGLEKGPNLDSPNAAEVSHMFFADALLQRRLSSIFATHPPLDERIRRIEPRWDGEYPEVRPVSASVREEEAVHERSLPPFGAMPTIPGIPQLPLPVLVTGAEEAVERIGKITPAQTAYASEFTAALPGPLQEAASEPFSARALIYCLLLNRSDDVRRAQLARLEAEADPRDYVETLRLDPMVAALPDAGRLPLIDLSVPALRRMSAGQYDVFRRQVEQLTAADMQVSLFEYMLACVLERHLDTHFRRPPPVPRRAATQSPTPHVVVVLSLLAREGHDDDAAARKAFDAGMRHYFRGSNPHELLPPNESNLEHLDQRLRNLATASLGAKRRILLACVACITFDHKAAVREVELYRAIGDVLGCPVPPLA